VIRPPYRLAAATIIAAMSLPAPAQETTDAILVTANRTPVTKDDTLASVDVITREDIEQQQAQDVPDLLGGLAGIDLTRNGGRGNTSSINIRGTSNDQTLVLVDGVRVASATTGGPELSNLAPEQIERIEVVRGPRASLYGADAIGGVIQIFTRRNAGANASVTAGGNNTRAATLGYGRNGEQGFWSLNAARHLTDGFDVKDGTEPDDDSFRQSSLSFRGAREITDNARVTAATQYREGEPRFDGDPNGSSNKQHSTRLGLELTPTDYWDFSVDVSRAFDDTDAREFGGGRFITERDSLTYQNDFYLGGSQILTLGGDWRRDKVSGTTDYTDDERENAAVFGQYQWRPSAWDLELSLRHDDNEAFGTQTTGSATAGYQFTKTTHGFVSYGTGFKAPSFNDLFFPRQNFGFFAFEGNPDLEPEKSRSWEAGLRGGNAWHWEVTAFYTEVEDLIVNQTEDEGGLFVTRPTNVREAEIPGVEASIGGELAGLETNLNATWVDPEDKETGNQLPRRSRYSANLDVSRAFASVRLGGAAQYRSERYDDFANDTELGSYITLDLRAGWQFAPQWQLRGIVRNATDRTYQTADGFNTEGRVGLITVSWNQGNQE